MSYIDKVMQEFDEKFVSGLQTYLDRDCTEEVKSFLRDVLEGYGDVREVEEAYQALKSVFTATYGDVEKVIEGYKNVKEVMKVVKKWNDIEGSNFGKFSKEMQRGQEAWEACQAVAERVK